MATVAKAVAFETVNISIDKQKKVATMQKFNGPNQTVEIIVNEDCWIKFGHRDVFEKPHEFLEKDKPTFLEAVAGMETPFEIYLPDGAVVQMTGPARMLQGTTKRPPWPILP
jgi:hypothetical protein